jgi:hypothetical protein
MPCIFCLQVCSVVFHAGCCCFFIGPPLFVCHWAYAKICVTIKFVKGGSPRTLRYPSNQIPCLPTVLSKPLLSGQCPLSLVLGFSQFNACVVVTLTRLNVAVGFCSILPASRRCALDPHRGSGRAHVPGGNLVMRIDVGVVRVSPKGDRTADVAKVQQDRW